MRGSLGLIQVSTEVRVARGPLQARRPLLGLVSPDETKAAGTAAECRWPPAASAATLRRKSRYEPFSRNWRDADGVAISSTHREQSKES